MPIDTQVYQSAPTQPQAPKSNGLWNLAPTIGSVLGGIGGEAADVFGGGIAGSALGGALGQQVENWATGSKGSDIGAGVGGGLGALGGNILGRVAGGLGGGALNTIAKFTAPKVAEDVGAATAPAVEGTEDAAYRAPFEEAMNSNAKRQRLSESADLRGTSQAMKQMNVEGTGQAWNDAGNFLAGNAEGPGAIITKRLDGIAKAQPNIVDDSLLGNVYKQIGFPNSSNMTPEESSSLKWISSQISDAQEKAPDGSVSYNPQKLMQSIRNIDSRYENNPIHNATPANPVQTTAAQQAEYNNLPKVKAMLEDAVYNRGGVNDAVAADKLTPEEESSIKQGAASKGVPQEIAQYGIDSINNGVTGPELKSASALGVHASQIGKETMQYSKGAKALGEETKGVQAAQKEADKAAADEAATKAKAAAQPHPAEAKTKSIIGALVGGPMDKLRALADVSGGFVPALNKIAGGGASALNKLPLTGTGTVLGGALGAGAGSAATTPQGGGMQPVSNTMGAPGMPGAPGGMAGGAMGSLGGGPTLANGQGLNTPNLLAQLDAMMSADPYLASSLAPVLQSLTPQVTAAQAAQGALGQYQNTLAAGGGGQGPLGGLMAQLGGLITGGPATQVGPQQAALQQLMTKAGAPGMYVPGLYANTPGAAAGIAPAQSVLGALGGQ